MKEKENSRTRFLNKVDFTRTFWHRLDKGAGLLETVVADLK